LWFANGQVSKPFRLKNGVAQGSVLAPILYNIYTADFSETTSKRYMYADGIALSYSNKVISTCQRLLTQMALKNINHQIGFLNISSQKKNF